MRVHLSPESSHRQKGESHGYEEGTETQEGSGHGTDGDFLNTHVVHLSRHEHLDDFVREIQNGWDEDDTHHQQNER